MKKKGKLTLNRETVRHLARPELTHAQGGGFTFTCPTFGCPSFVTCAISCGGTCDPGCVAPTTTLYC